MHSHMNVKIFWNLSLYFNISFVGKSVSNYLRRLN
jgi:hypothetical protein